MARASIWRFAPPSIQEAKRDRGVPRRGCAGRLPILPYDEAAASWHANERARLGKRGRRPLPDSLPVCEVVHDLPEEEKVCPHPDHRMVEIGRESSDRLRFIPAYAEIERHIRPKYACAQCREGAYGIILLGICSFFQFVSCRESMLSNSCRTSSNVSNL